MTDLMRRIRRAVFKSADASEAELRDALNELGVSGGSGDPKILRRIQRAILTDGHDEDENLRAALDDLQIGGGLDEPRPMDRVRRAILRPPRNAEVLLRKALDDLGVEPEQVGGGGDPEGDHITFNGDRVVVDGEPILAPQE